MKLLRTATADRTGVGSYRSIGQAKAVENIAIGLVHYIVGFLQRSLVEIE